MRMMTIAGKKFQKKGNSRISAGKGNSIAIRASIVQGVDSFILMTQVGAESLPKANFAGNTTNPVSI